MLERGAALPTSAYTEGEGGECPDGRRRGQEGAWFPSGSWEETLNKQDGAGAGTGICATLCRFRCPWTQYGQGWGPMSGEVGLSGGYPRNPGVHPFKRTGQG